MRWVIILKNMEKVEIAGEWLRAETNAFGERTTLRVKDGASYVAEFDGKIVAGWYKVPEEDQPGFRWTPLAEALPENDEFVLITMSWGSISVGSRYAGGHWYTVDGEIDKSDDQVLAWAPLPEPYKEEQDEQGAG